MCPHVFMKQVCCYVIQQGRMRSCPDTCRCSSWLLMLNLSCRVVMSAASSLQTTQSSPRLTCKKEMIAHLRLQDTCTLTTTNIDRGVPAALDNCCDEPHRGARRFLPCVQLQVRILYTTYHGDCPAPIIICGSCKQRYSLSSLQWDSRNFCMIMMMICSMQASGCFSCWQNRIQKKGADQDMPSKPDMSRVSCFSLQLFKITFMGS